MHISLVPDRTKPIILLQNTQLGKWRYNLFSWGKTKIWAKNRSPFCSHFLHYSCGKSHRITAKEKHSPPRLQGCRWPLTWLQFPLQPVLLQPWNSSKLKEDLKVWRRKQGESKKRARRNVGVNRESRTEENRDVIPWEWNQGEWTHSEALSLHSKDWDRKKLHVDEHTIDRARSDCCFPIFWLIPTWIIMRTDTTEGPLLTQDFNWVKTS